MKLSNKQVKNMPAKSVKKTQKLIPHRQTQVSSPFQANRERLDSSQSKLISQSFLDKQRIQSRVYQKAVQNLDLNKNKQGDSIKETKGKVLGKSRNSEKSLTLQKNQLHSVSSKGILSTKNSNYNQFSSETGKNMGAQQTSRIKKEHLLSQESQDPQKIVSHFQSGQSFIYENESKPEKEYSKEEIKQVSKRESPLFSGNKENKSRRESSINQSDVNEHDIDEHIQAANEIKVSIVNKHILQPKGLNRDQRKVNVETKKLKESCSQTFINHSVTMKKQVTQKAKQDWLNEFNKYKPDFLKDNNNWIDRRKGSQLQLRSPSQEIFLSRIENNNSIPLQDSKPSESELGILMNFPYEQKETSKQCKDLLCCFSCNQGKSFSRKIDQEQGSSDNQGNGMMRVDSQQEKIELSLPVDIDEENEYVTENSQKHNTDSSGTNASQGIKSYLTSLRRLRVKYKEICQELVNEENSNIHTTLQSVLQSEEYRRLSLSSKSSMLTAKIIDIRDEYRNVLQLLKTQHNFDAEFENDDD